MHKPKSNNAKCKEIEKPIYIILTSIGIAFAEVLY
jgi:hypothetical protein